MSSEDTGAMSDEHNEKSALVPRLRFPEFREAGEWGCELGGVLFDQISNKDHNSDLPVLAITQEHGAVPRSLIDYHVSVADKSIEGYKVVEIGDFIISLRSFQGGIEYSRYKGICSPAYVILRLAPEHSTDYFRHFLKTDRFIGQLTKNLEGLRDGKMVSYKQFSELQLPNPSRKEQQKIADCLSSLDELIAAEANKLDALKTHKKGLMQQLFPAEGETLPRLRFPEFRDAGEWEETTLGSIAKFASGGTPSKDVSEYWGGTTPWISASSMYETNLCKSDMNITDQAVRDGARIAKQGTLLILVRGSMLYNRVPMGITSIDVSFNQDVKALTIKHGINTVFLLYELLAYELRIPVDKTGIGAGKIETDELKRLPIYIPSLIEQQKIADCLAALDDLIAAQAQKIELLKRHKKGLMQQLFPRVAGASSPSAFESREQDAPATFCAA